MICTLVLLTPRQGLAHGAYHDVVRELTPQIEGDPGNTGLRIRLLAAHVGHDEWQLALEEVERIRKLAPGKHELGYFEGRSLAVAQRWDEAEEPLTAFLEKHPNHLEALAWRARVRQSTGDQAGANADYAKACATSRDPELLREFALTLVAQGRAHEAVAMLRGGLKRMPEDPALLDCLVDCSIKAGDADTVLATIATLQRTWPRPEPWMKRRAVYLAEIGRGEQSRAAWSELRDHIMALPNLERAQPFLAELLDEARVALGETTVAPVIAPPAPAAVESP